MEYGLSLGGLIVRFRAQRPLVLTPELVPFRVDPGGAADVEVTFSWDWQALSLPQGRREGQDLFQDYFLEEGNHWCMTRGGVKGYLAAAVYTPDCRHIQCTIHAEPFLQPPSTLASALRLLPMRAIFQTFGISFFHASQVAVRGRGLLFTAPSGTGKSTQAGLWRDTVGATILCNARTLVRRAGAGYVTYGYPIDGSQPVSSTETADLAAIVLLSQGPENDVRRLGPARALTALMPQLVIDVWSAAARQRAGELLLELLERIPVYHLTCTPDAAAVRCLRDRLKTDGVMDV